MKLVMSQVSFMRYREAYLLDVSFYSGYIRFADVTSYSHCSLFFYSAKRVYYQLFLKGKRYLGVGQVLKLYFQQQRKACSKQVSKYQRGYGPIEFNHYATFQLNKFENKILIFQISVECECYSYFTVRAPVSLQQCALAGAAQQEARVLFSTQLNHKRKQRSCTASRCAVVAVCLACVFVERLIYPT